MRDMNLGYCLLCRRSMAAEAGGEDEGVAEGALGWEDMMVG
jgi:hypothetical protein